jgi:hypothetical protein
MNLHKYVADGKTFFLLSESPSKPAGTLSVKQEDWQGRALGRYNTVVKQLGSLTWTKKEEEEPSDSEPSKKACLSQVLRGFVSTIKE